MEQKPKVQESDYLPKRGNPLQETVCYTIGGTVYEVETSCGGTELLYDKMVRLIRSETITYADKDIPTTSPLYTPACPKRMRWTARATALPIRRKSF